MGIKACILVQRLLRFLVDPLLEIAMALQGHISVMKKASGLPIVTPAEAAYLQHLSDARQGRESRSLGYGFRLKAGMTGCGLQAIVTVITPLEVCRSARKSAAASQGTGTTPIVDRICHVIIGP